MTEIIVNCKQSSPCIVNNCVIMGKGFFQLDKISFVSDDKMSSINHMGSNYEISYFNVVCDGVEFKIVHNTQDFDSYERIDNHGRKCLRNLILL